MNNNNNHNNNNNKHTKKIVCRKMQPEKNCLHRQQHRKKLFVLKNFSSPPLQKNNGPSLTTEPLGDSWRA